MSVKTAWWFIVVGVVICGGCGVGLGKTGAGWGGLGQSRGDVFHRTGGDSQYDYGYTTHDGLSPVNGPGLRFGVDFGYRLGRGVGTLNGLGHAYGLAGALTLEGQVAYGRMSLSLGHGQMFQQMEFAGGNQLHFQADEYTLQVGYALRDWLSVHAGAATLSSPNYGLGKESDDTGTGSGHRVIAGVNMLLFQKAVFNIGIRIEGSTTSETGALPMGGPASFSGYAVVFEPYVTAL